MNAIEFLRGKGFLDENSTQFVVRWTTGRKVDIVRLLEEYKAVNEKKEPVKKKVED